MPVEETPLKTQTAGIRTRHYIIWAGYKLSAVQKYSRSVYEKTKRCQGRVGFGCLAYYVPLQITGNEKSNLEPRMMRNSKRQYE